MAKKKTRKKKAKFRGRIIPSTYDFQTAASDVIGPHHVLYPTSKAMLLLRSPFLRTKRPSFEAAST